MANKDIRSYAKQKGVKFWQIADVIGISEITMSRRLRYELSESDKAEIMQIIDELSERK